MTGDLASGFYRVRIGISGGMIHAASATEPVVITAEDGKTVESVKADWTKDGDTIGMISWPAVQLVSWRWSPGIAEISAAADGTAPEDESYRSRLGAVSRVAAVIRDHPRCTRRDIQFATSLPADAVRQATNDLHSAGKVTRRKIRKSYTYTLTSE